MSCHHSSTSCNCPVHQLGAAWGPDQTTVPCVGSDMHSLIGHTVAPPGQALGVKNPDVMHHASPKRTWLLGSQQAAKEVIRLQCQLCRLHFLTNRMPLVEAASARHKLQSTLSWPQNEQPLQPSKKVTDLNLKPVTSCTSSPTCKRTTSCTHELKKT